MRQRHGRLMAIVNVFMLLALLSLWTTHPAFAHGDEDHSQEQKKTAAPKVSAGGGQPTQGLQGLQGLGESPQRLADGSLFVPKSLQRQLKIRTQVAKIGAVSATIELNGQVIANPNFSGRIQAWQQGRIEPGPKGMPTLGRQVKKGETLAYLHPIGGSIERGNQRALLADIEAQLAIAQDRVVRLEQLEGAVAQKDIDAARLERQALQKRRLAVNASINVAEPLISPVSGVISASSVVAGQVVDAKELLFEIIDPMHLSVEALAYDARLAALIVEATAIADNEVDLSLKFIGGGKQLNKQALPLLFNINNTSKGQNIAVGQPVKVLVQTKQTINAAAIARQAIVKHSEGYTILWVHSESERFSPRKVQVQSLDANHVAVLDGVHDGDRVVIEGAGFISQIR